MNPTQQLEALIKKYVKNECTEQEVQTLLNAFNIPGNEELLKVLLTEQYHNLEITGDASPEDELVFEQIHHKLISRIKQGDETPKIRWLNWRVAAAAIIIIAACAGIIFSLKLPQRLAPANDIVKTTKTDILPGSSKAILTLANGKKMILSNIPNGVIARQGNTVIHKDAAGTLINIADTHAQGNNLNAYNIVETPIGGEYSVTLADGTKVWMNAASSLKYPVQFSDNERVVELTGEAYFEVAKDAAKPFKVKSSGQTIEVLGTHFNINAYENEEVMKTTLLEGRVKVLNKTGVQFLNPGQQSVMNFGGDGRIKVLTDMDTDEVTAWKEGYFQFNQADIHTVMRQLSRWYDIKVSYSPEIASKEFQGAIQRDLKFSQVLRILGKTKLHFTVKGKEVMVMD